MIDQEKVIKGLNHCFHGQECCGDTECPYYIELFSDACLEYCQDDLKADVLSLLKEQEVVSGHWLDDTGHWIEGDRNGTDPHARTTGEMIDTFRCSWCGFYQYWKTPFCPNCGAKME